LSQIEANMMEISECCLRLERPVRSHEAPFLREVFGREFEERVLQHNRGPDGEQVFEYPRVQFKVHESTATLLGVMEGSELLKKLWEDFDEGQLDSSQLGVVSSSFETREERLDSTPEPLKYRILTPWLALNEKNFRAYTGSRNQKFRRDELSRILVGNCMGMAKSLGVHFSEHVTADCGKLVSIKTTVGGKGMIGFVGRFQINLRIPEYLGLGKSVARGFGMIAEG
jgi:hypothetical protein